MLAASRALCRAPVPARSLTSAASPLPPELADSLTLRRLLPGTAVLRAALAVDVALGAPETPDQADVRAAGDRRRVYALTPAPGASAAVRDFLAQAPYAPAPPAFIQAALAPAAGAMPNNVHFLTDVPLAPGAVATALQHPTQVDPSCDTAVFYSLNAPQGGLALGARVLDEALGALTAESAGRIRFWGTLSPIPGFGRWLSSPESPLPGGLPPALADRLVRHSPRIAALTAEGTPSMLHALARFLQERSAAAPAALFVDPEEEQAIGAALMFLMSHYVTSRRARGGGGGGGGGPVDSVARFHLGNGARLGAIHWRAQTTPMGIAGFGTIMANYIYDLDKVEHRREHFRAGGQRPDGPELLVAEDILLWRDPAAWDRPLVADTLAKQRASPWCPGS
ncbi:hypothetical protein H696_05751 [Fonticula alba]|uniref:Malonyl-CoA decarboxylase C-terminal domain-containing protein n=1 Tax=Fonticula alba TaxID=691883 RepID=A0A058Z0L3_FONAL|nr:hypothetical protein H696_05751 [Fonticula alba]KCV67809.1 hypothetical protein H696_05751 [Fonticula alba]|eukprot:XP_009497840.1 hypothetical protein H696_05751 [Fonticula alba]